MPPLTSIWSCLGCHRLGEQKQYWAAALRVWPDSRKLGIPINASYIGLAFTALPLLFIPQSHSGYKSTCTTAAQSKAVIIFLPTVWNPGLSSWLTGLMWPWAHSAAACSVQELALIPRWKGSRPEGSGSHQFTQTNADKFTNPQIHIHVKGTDLIISDTIVNNVKTGSALTSCFPFITVGKTEQILENEPDTQVISVKNALNSSKNLCTFVLLFESSVYSPTPLVVSRNPASIRHCVANIKVFWECKTVSVHSRKSLNFCQ